MHSEPIILIDAYAQIYRGYYAVRNLTNSKGMPTNAVFAMAKFLLSLEKTNPSRHGAVVFDIGRPAHRLKLAPDYKATRPPMPEDLRQQVPHIRELLSGFGWPILEKEGWEADDLIAGLALNFTDYPVLIVSGDKDIAQVIDERIRMLVPSKDGGLSIRGREEVFAKFDVPPEKIVDYLSLIGDSSDNIPGVNGVGPKTAAKLLAEFPSIPALLQNLDKLENQKLREKIRDAAAQLSKNIELISLVRTLPEESWKEISSLERRNPEIPKLMNLAKELELKNLLSELDKIKQTPSESSLGLENPTAPPAPYTPDLFG